MRTDALLERAPHVVNITGTSQERRLFSTLTPLEVYTHVWETELTVGIEGFSITESLRHWVNDGLMTLFFFLLGLEIKREVLVGELRYPRQAAWAIAAAVGASSSPL